MLETQLEVSASETLETHFEGLVSATLRTQLEVSASKTLETHFESLVSATLKTQLELLAVLQAYWRLLFQSSELTKESEYTEGRASKCPPADRIVIPEGDVNPKHHPFYQVYLISNQWTSPTCQLKVWNSTKKNDCLFKVKWL